MPHFYERNIIEIKEEYTTFLINIITPFLYEGIKSFYNYAQESHIQLLEKGKIDNTIKSPGVLKLFQACLKEVPSLNDYAIETETNRIKEKSKCSEWFDDLVKAVIKSNIVLLTFTADNNKSDIVNDKYHERINVKNFIHKCYIECARIIYNYPELFWHDYPSIEIKRNQRETFNLMERAIREAIRKILPIKMILKEFLKNDYIPDNNGITNKISESHYMNIKSMIDRDLHNVPQEQEQLENHEHNNIIEHHNDIQNEYKEINDDKIMEQMDDINKQIKQSNDFDNSDNSDNSDSSSEMLDNNGNSKGNSEGNSEDNSENINNNDIFCSNENINDNKSNGPIINKNINKNINDNKENNNTHNLYPKKKITGHAKKLWDNVLDENNINNPKNNKETFFNKYTN